MEITKEVAERIINSKVLIEEALVPYKGVVVSYVGFTDANDEPFMWEDTEEEFALVSFKAMNSYQLGLAVEQFQDEEYDDCVNHNMVMRMNVEKARTLSAGITMGTLICHEVTTEVDGEDVTVLVPKAYSATESKVAKKVSLAELLGKKVDKKASKDKSKGDKKDKSKKDKLKVVDEEFEPKGKKDKSDKKGKKAKLKV